ncbi:MAG: hypothetical protein L3J08_09220 [Flavobacteriaceae bacterium]|nr:hypothetical protein [Flavobacteriaceae bacterium]
MSKKTTSRKKTNKPIRFADKDFKTTLLGNSDISKTITEKNLKDAYNITSSTYASIPNILEEIFAFVYNNYKTHKIPIPNFDKGVIQLKEKIKKNFISTTYQDVLNEYYMFWESKTIVENYIQSNFSEYEMFLYAILDTIRNSFINHPSNRNNKVDAPVQSPTVLQDLSNALIPKENINPLHKATALSLVLFFFEYCDFGKKHSKDPLTLFPKFERNNDFT